MTSWSRTASLKVNKNQDPEELGDKIAALESAYGTPIVEKHKVAAIVIAAGKDYGNVIREVVTGMQLFKELVCE